MTQPVRHDDKLTSAPAPHIARVPELQPAYSTVNAKSSVCADSSVASETMIVSVVKEIVGEQNFQHWFQKRCRFDVAGDQLLVRVANPFILSWMLRRFRSMLTRAAQTLLGPSASCQLEVDERLMSEVPAAGDAVASSILSSSSPTTESVRQEKLEAPASSSSSEAAEGSARPVVRSHARRVDRPADADQATGLQLPSNRRRFRGFESFVSGECNNLAVLAAKQISANPGDRYNPLFIYGGTGTGKTHLLEAIYSDVRRRFPTKNVMYLTSEAFTNYFTSALASRTVPSFRQRFRNVDVLLVDNIEFLDNKRATQEEFLHTIVQVSEHGGQVVISSDRHPRMLTKHREELTTRFLSGLVCRVESPDEETRRQLAKSFTASMKAIFCDDALDYVLRRCGKGVRELQGALNQLESFFSLTGRRITLAVARETLGGMEEECKRLVRISDVEKIVCEVFGVTTAELRSGTRRKAVALPRSIAMFLSRKLTKSAYREIGSYFGGRDHSTVVAAERRVSELVTAGGAVGLPTTCAGRTVAELVDELERRLMAS
ncbi:MAG: chromosomal replication initiator protein DnaA [Planctomycetaceae bacterium]|nr:chromosomal replication initiator protein DnaA [Planctomycetaceae bacterium]